ncbi:MAG: DUF3152 domain-containing protein, partial [Angustibacter sp.]
MGHAHRGRRDARPWVWGGASFIVLCALLFGWTLMGNGVPGFDAGPRPATLVAPTTSGPINPSRTPTRSASPTPSAKRVDPLDVRISLAKVPDDGSGQLTTVPGDSPASGPGRAYRVRVQIESALTTKLGLSPDSLAEFVVDTLNDDRSWSHGGKRSFSRTDSAGEVTVIV